MQSACIKARSARSEFRLSRRNRVRARLTAIPLTSWSIPKVRHLRKVHVPDFPPTKANRLCTGALFPALLSWFIPRRKYRAKGSPELLARSYAKGLGCD